MENKLRRPKTVLTAQIILLGGLLLFIALPFKQAMFIWDTLTFAGRPMLTRSEILPFLFRYLLAFSPLIFLNLASSILMALRWPFGRWLGVVSLSLFLLLLIGHIAGGSPLAIILKADWTQLTILIILQIALSVLIFLVVFQLILDPRVTTFFKPEVNPPSTEPPPPPSFDS